jgi:FKBP-type peptidyl-prolyl cis-trans isomerase
MATTPIRSFFYLLLLGALLLTLALVVDSHLLARKDPGAPMSAAMRETLQPAVRQFNPEESKAIRDKFPEAKSTASGLLSIVRAPGSGPTPRPGQKVTVHYEGRLLDGTLFDSSRTRGQPLSFLVGEGNVIPGWDEALALMQKGEKRTLIIPFWLAYGEDGHPPSIPPRATLVFEVELLDIQ